MKKKDLTVPKGVDFKKMLTIMKLSTFLLIIGALNIYAGVYSQDAKISVTIQNGSLTDLFNVIEAKTDYKIFYKSSLINGVQDVNLNADQKSVSELLAMALSGRKLTYDLVDKVIVITPSETVSVFQQGKISGAITDATTGEPLIGVNVTVEGTTIGVVSDINGNFSIDPSRENAILVFSYVGYNIERIPYTGQSTINVKMVPDITKLEEVVVVGYGTQQRGSVTGSVAKVSGKDIASLPVNRMDQALQGKVAGVTVTNSGAPGTAPVVRIRGVGSVSFSSDPLYVVDGIPAMAISGLDAKDIESIDVLKDAAASAIYGSRGANGVVIITTKKGSGDGKFTIDLDCFVGKQNAWKQLDLMNREEYITWGKSLLTNAGAAFPSRWTNGGMDKPIYPGATQTYNETETDWQDEMFRTAWIQQHNLSVSGGTQKSKFYSSVGYMKQDGIMLGTNYSRLNFRLNSNHEISKHISFGETFTLSNDYNRSEVAVGNASQIRYMIMSVPYIPVYDPTRLGGYAASSPDDGSDSRQPVLLANLIDNNNSNFRLMASAFTDIKITSFLKFRSSVGLENNYGRTQAYTPLYNASTYQNNLVAASLNRTFSNFTSWLYTNQLTFDKAIGSHQVNATVVAEQQVATNKSLSGTGSLATNAIQELVGISNPQTNSGFTNERLYSYLGRLQYSFANKYILSTSFRADGSSRFAPGNKWGYFKSFSVGYRISEEPFMKNISAITDLKLRASYGETGFNGIGNYVWQAPALAEATQYVLNGVKAPGSMIENLGNKELKWETTNMINVGIDLKLFDALSFSAEYYNRKTDNLIVGVPLAPSSGIYNNKFENIGSMENKGMEFQLGYSKQFGQLTLNLGGNLAANINKVNKLYGNTPIYSGFDNALFTTNCTRTMAGRSIQEFYGYQVDGIFQSQTEIDQYNAIDGNAASKYQDKAAPGDIRFKDISGPEGNPDGKVDAYDQTSIGSYLPKFTYGFNISAAYKGLDFSVFLQGSQGNKIMNGTKVLLQRMTRLFNGGPECLNAWTPTNTNTDIPRAINGDPNQNARVSDRWVEDGSYLRVKNISLGYTLPADILTSFWKGNIKSVRFYVSSQNLLTFTKYSGYDPEIGARSIQGLSNTSGNLAQGVDYGQYPQPRTFMAGIQVRF